MVVQLERRAFLRACLILKKMKLDRPIRMYVVYMHWKMPQFDDGGVMKDGKLKYLS